MAVNRDRGVAASARALAIATEIAVIVQNRGLSISSAARTVACRRKIPWATARDCFYRYRATLSC